MSERGDMRKAWAGLLGGLGLGGGARRGAFQPMRAPRGLERKGFGEITDTRRGWGTPRQKSSVPGATAPMATGDRMSGSTRVDADSPALQALRSDVASRERRARRAWKGGSLFRSMWGGDLAKRAGDGVLSDAERKQRKEAARARWDKGATARAHGARKDMYAVGVAAGGGALGAGVGVVLADRKVNRDVTGTLMQMSEDRSDITRMGHMAAREMEHRARGKRGQIDIIEPGSVDFPRAKLTAEQQAVLSRKRRQIAAAMSDIRGFVPYLRSALRSKYAAVGVGGGVAAGLAANAAGLPGYLAGLRVEKLAKRAGDGVLSEAEIEQRRAAGKASAEARRARGVPGGPKFSPTRNSLYSQYVPSKGDRAEWAGMPDAPMPETPGSGPFVRLSQKPQVPKALGEAKYVEIGRWAAQATREARPDIYERAGAKGLLPGEGRRDNEAKLDPKAVRLAYNHARNLAMHDVGLIRYDFAHTDEAIEQLKPLIPFMRYARDSQKNVLLSGRPGEWAAFRREFGTPHKDGRVHAFDTRGQKAGEPKRHFERRLNFLVDKDGKSPRLADLRKVPAQPMAKGLVERLAKADRYGRDIVDGVYVGNAASDAAYRARRAQRAGI